MLKMRGNWAGPEWRKFVRWAGFLFPLFLLALGVGFSDSSRAQSLSPDALGQLRQQFGQQNGGTGANSSDLTGGPGYQTTIIQSMSAPNLPPLPPSRLEQIMSARAGGKLNQFGYDQFGQGRPVTMPQTGAMTDDYILGPGDQIVVSLRGQENTEVRAEINRNGQIVLPRLSPIPAAGRSFGDFRRDLEAAVRRSYVATNAFASVSRVRQISVIVSGEVNVPGQRLLTGLSSAIDAILISGGVKKTGSLRNIRVQRGGRDFQVDLYGMLTSNGSASGFRLADGDRILIPPLGRTVAVTGLVRQPGIFELRPGEQGISAKNLLALAGGQEVRGNYRLSIMRIDAQGRASLDRLSSQAQVVRDSEILFAQLGADQTTNQATLSGGTGLAGQYPISTGTRLSEVLKAPGSLGPAPYTLFGIISRKDSRTLLRQLVAFTPLAVMNGGEDQVLQSDDIIRVLSVNETRLLTNTVMLYRRKQDAQQEAIRNPLSVADQQIPSPAAATGRPGAITAVAGGSSDAQMNIADAQRADIANLAMAVDPVTQQVQDAQLLAQRQQQAQQQAQMQQQSLQNSLQIQQLQTLNPAQGQLLASGSALPATPAPTSPPTGTQQSGAPADTQNLPLPPTNIALNFQSTDGAAGQVASNREIANFGELAKQLNVDQLVLINFLMDRQANLNGAVGGPGPYFVGPDVGLQDLVQAAGGTINWADESGVELISTAVDTQSGKSATRRVTLPLRKGTLANYVVRPHDELRFNQIFADSGLGSATVQGEVRFTGTYQITRGERLSELMLRAGGVTSTGYPAGTVFLRRSAAQKEHEGYVRAAAEIENQLVVAMTHVGNDKIDPSTFASMQSFVNELRNQKAIGRIAIMADPSVLASKPELDPLLEPGDVIYIPQRPTTISVLGQVMQPGSFPYRSGMTLADYIEQAGGYAATSDESMTFVVLPDGSARRVRKSWLSFDAETLPPGSTIVVPRDVTPINTRQLILDVSSIFSQFAVSIASMAVLAKQ